ncbi:MAG: broad specificity phosphatase PhoE [Solumvirus sp.]|uniref:Broad specificity phosphatase PhoE n=1 Tax=Solumvirus sp. TaxID=2487773 RepID=A0A3G5AGE4_9VIRU|nr:MAG: broad specificity phosphatase PhoE [Solumvirus sp.]
MVVVYLRHSNDEIPSGEEPTYKHDQHINKDGRKLVKSFAKKFIHEFGHPQIVYYSPFNRGRETMKGLKKYFNKNVRYLVDPRLSRFFTPQEKKECDISKKTKKHEPPISESRKQFHKRVYEQADDMIKYLSTGLVLCITHAVVLKRVAHRFKIKLPEHYEFLEYFSLSSKK